MSERLEMKCKRCGDNEDRIDGFCSNECKDKYSLEAALSKMSIRIAELEALVERLIEAGDRLSDSEKFFENLDKVRDMLGERFTDENPNDFFDNLRKGA